MGKRKGFGRHGSSDDSKMKLTGYEWIHLFKFINHKTLFFLSSLICFISDLSEPLTSLIEGKLAVILISNVYNDGETFIKDINNLSNNYIFLCLICFLLGIFHTIVEAYLLPKIHIDLKMAVMKSFMHQDISFYDQTESGVLLARLTKDAKLACTSYTTRLVNVARYVFKWFSGLFLMFTQSKILTLYMCLYLPIYLFINWIGDKKTDNLWVSYNNCDTQVSATVEEVLTSIRTVRSFSAEENEYKILKNELMSVHECTKKNSLIIGLKNFALDLINYSSIALILYIGGNLAMKKEISVSAIIIFIEIHESWQKSVLSIMSKLDDYKKANVSSAKVLEILQKEPVGKLYQGIDLDHVSGKIEFRDVCFTYPTRNKPALNHLSFEVLPGETIAIVGESGCGKSTILQLIERFYDPQEGEILIDGINIKNISPMSFRKFIAYVPQLPAIFSMPIKDNIRFGEPHAPKDDIIKASKLAYSHQFIVQQPDGYNTTVKQNSLSGGQKQRLCFARAILINAPIMILDEATAALDAESENLIQQAITEYKEGKTMIIVAHRLSTVKYADRIIVVSNGEIVEQGKHEELLSKGGAYSELVKNQLL